MHSLRLLTLLLPELKAIDALVVRDFYHRFTVDEHSFLAIENLHRLRQARSEWEKHYAEILAELEQPELLYLSLLLHDTGKGEPSDNHVVAAWRLRNDAWSVWIWSRRSANGALSDWQSPGNVGGAPPRYLRFGNRRCIRGQSGNSRTAEDALPVYLRGHQGGQSDALTPWKAENVWQLYISAANQLNRNVDQRLHLDADANDEKMTRLRTLAPTAGKKVKAFLEGLPQRYLKTYAASEVLHHLEMSESLGNIPSSWISSAAPLVRTDPGYQRPSLLFGKVAGALAAWGMNIVKATAFSNLAGTVVDAFYFTDRFRTLELNLSEWERFKRGISDVLMEKQIWNPC